MRHQAGGVVDDHRDTVGLPDRAQMTQRSGQVGHVGKGAERGAGEHESVGRGDLLHAAGGSRVPVLDALRLVEDHEIRRPCRDQVEVPVHRVVVGDLVEALRPESLFAAPTGAPDDTDRPVDDPGDLPLPLVLERGRTHDEHALHAEVAGDDLDGGDRLDRFP